MSPRWEERSRESLTMQQILPDETALKLRSSQFRELQLTFLWGLQMSFPISPLCGFTETSYCKPSMPQTKLIFLPKSASPLTLLCYNNNSLYLLNTLYVSRMVLKVLAITSKWIISLKSHKTNIIVIIQNLQLRKLRHKVTTQLRGDGARISVWAQSWVLGLLI